jgi:hypothetical protein
MARGIRRSDKRIKSPVRLARMKAAYEAAWPSFKSCQIWSFVTPDLAAQIEDERDLYAVRPSLSSVVGELIVEGLAFRKMHRSPPRPSRAKRVPFPIDI